MAENYMPEVAKMLGVELGEKFEIEGIDGKFVFETSGLKTIDNNHLGTAPVTLCNLLYGAYQIVRRPWRPKVGDVYWRLYIYEDGEYEISDFNYTGVSLDIDFILMNNFFPSREAAEAAAPEIVKFYEDVRKMVEE